ncbi:MAG: hypothetical protein KF905_05350 [Flavobacteriales bacterium]|nr:hypothetical protein [Flavobacteriales bacterium]
MRIPAFLFTFLLAPCMASAQDAMLNERAAKDAVQRIVRHSGLQPGFTVVENLDIPTAIAYIKGKQRIIAYNPGFMARVMDSTCTNWSAISILAHEIAHHLLGHTLDPGQVHPGDELACDHYSGFILHAMGATLEEALATQEVTGDPHGTHRHPPKHARIQAIRQGWEEARAIAERREPEPFHVHDAFRFVVRFTGDANTYYVDAEDRLVWFNNLAEPIQFGRLEQFPNKDAKYRLSWNDEDFVVDGREVIWKRTATGMQMKVGTMSVYARQ